MPHTPVPERGLKPPGSQARDPNPPIRSPTRTTVLPPRGSWQGLQRRQRNGARLRAGTLRSRWGGAHPQDLSQRARAPKARQGAARGTVPTSEGTGRRGGGARRPPAHAPPSPRNPQPRCAPSPPAPLLLTEGPPPRQRRARPATARLAAAASFLPAARGPEVSGFSPEPARSSRRAASTRTRRAQAGNFAPPAPPPPALRPALPLSVLTPLPARPPSSRRPFSISSQVWPPQWLFVSPLPSRLAPAWLLQSPVVPARAFSVPSHRPTSSR